MTVILVAKDGKNLVPINVTTQQRLDYAVNFTIYDINPDGTKSAPFGPTSPAAAAPTLFPPPGTGGGGTWGSITGTLASQSDLNTRFATDEASITANAAAAANAIKFGANWNPATNVVTGVAGVTSLANSNPGAQTSFQSTVASTTAVAYLGAITSVKFQDVVQWNTISGAWQLLPFSDDAKEPVTTVGTTGNQTLTSAQNNQVIPTSTASVITVNTGLLPAGGFGCAFVGAGVVTFAGSATVTDKRTTGATNPACSLVPTGTDVYSVIGSKA